MGNFNVKRVTERTGISRLVRTATILRVMRKTGLKWIHAQKKGELTKSDLKLTFVFSWKVRIGVFLEGLLETIESVDWMGRILFERSTFYTK